MALDSNAKNAPEHVAIIMDGNGRWAQSRGKPRLFGHHAGARRVREVVEACPDLGVKYLTIFAFSTENWKRTQVEVAGLMSLFRRYITKEARALKDEGVRVRFIGDRVRLDKKLQTLMDELEQLTEHNDRVHLTIALNYGGRDEVARATKLLRRTWPLAKSIPKPWMAKRWRGILIRMFCLTPIWSSGPAARRGSRTSCCGNRPMRNTNLSTPCGPISRAKSSPMSSLGIASATGATAVSRYEQRREMG